MTRILFVCLGNICRSPTAEAVMVELVEQAGMSDRFTIESAGTGNWHVGEPPDHRATQAAGGRGIRLRGAARQVSPEDFEQFDLIVAMDRSNLADLERLADSREARAKLRLLREFESPDIAAGADGAGGDRGPGARAHGGSLDVPDPYHGGADGFERVLDLVQRCCEGLLEQLTTTDGASPHPASD